MQRKTHFIAFALLCLLALPPAVNATEQDKRIMQSLAPKIDGAVPAFAREDDAEFDITDEKDYIVQCPPELRNQVMIDSKNSSDWIVGGEGRNSPLKGGRMFIGPASESTIQKYNELTAIPAMNKEKAQFQQTWALDEQMYEAGVLLVCDYAGNNHYLLRAVPRGVKQCQEVDVIDKNNDTPPKVRCK